MLAVRGYQPTVSSPIVTTFRYDSSTRVNRCKTAAPATSGGIDGSAHSGAGDSAMRPSGVAGPLHWRHGGFRGRRGQSGGGLQPPRAVSIHLAAASAMSSRHGRATTCTPIGRPSGDVPARTTTQGYPVRL